MIIFLDGQNAYVNFKLKLLKLNINKNKVFISNNCTYCFEEKYDSFRREGPIAGRMYAVLGWEA